MNWLKNWDETEGKVQLEHYANAMPHNNLCLRDNHLGILLGPHKNISQKFPKSLE
jgi:hypothetical protein